MVDQNRRRGILRQSWALLDTAAEETLQGPRREGVQAVVDGERSHRPDRGSDGFGFATVKGIQKKIPQIGTVVIEDDVEIGANVTIDRARFDKTIIGKGTKIDNLVQIAHNVVTGPNCIIVAQAGISGSTTLGKSVILAGQAGLVGHITVGEGAIVAAQAGVTKSIAAHTKVSGYPAKPHNIAKRVNACVQRLPEAYSKIRELEEKVKNLEERLQSDG